MLPSRHEEVGSIGHVCVNPDWEVTRMASSLTTGASVISSMESMERQGDRGTVMNVERIPSLNVFPSLHCSSTLKILWIDKIFLLKIR